MRRREYLAAAGSLVPLAGCASVPLSGGGSPSRDPTAEPTSGNESCERHDIVDVVRTDQLGGFTMVANPASVSHGEGVTVRMENATGEEQVTGNRHKFTVHEPSGEGWRSVYADAETGWNDIGIQHQPGEGFTWEFGASRAGLSAAPNHLDACAAVEPGTYRFVYWGVTSESERESDWEDEYGLGVEFAVTG